MDKPEARDRDVLEVLSDGRANPYLIRDKTGLDKGDTNTVLNRLGRSGYVRQITRGLYEITEEGRSELRDRGSPERESPAIRRHETYEQDNWKVLDIEGVDNIFSTWGRDIKSNELQVRVDIDGVIADSAMNDLGHTGDNINTSIWLSLDAAHELNSELTKAIEEGENKQESE
ncbi:hypothetical protein PM038_00105 [Halorubrum ezzemoulense]|uniref:hypothetical protein n=1 Tax=Halorubrum ezzemoulense TaxID=337243 RepID=UPI00232B9D96|nr:hypothetical protein [Halorubrum ezzemoulense]MDB2283677.1 hypothetical protein [Halorubrum ezzemoulense]